MGIIPILDDMASDVKILRLEDGYMRSVGLVADLINPLSESLKVGGLLRRDTALLY